jgi:hypothetical protein
MLVHATDIPQSAFDAHERAGWPLPRLVIHDICGAKAKQFIVPEAIAEPVRKSASCLPAEIIPDC